MAGSIVLSGHAAAAARPVPPPPRGQKRRVEASRQWYQPAITAASLLARLTLASSSLPFHTLVSPLYSYRRSLRFHGAGRTVAAVRRRHPQRSSARPRRLPLPPPLPLPRKLTKHRLWWPAGTDRHAPEGAHSVHVKGVLALADTCQTLLRRRLVQHPHIHLEGVGWGWERGGVGQRGR